MQNLRLKINFWGEYEEEIKSLLIEKNKTRIRELFAICYLNYLDEVLTPVENFGIKGEKLADFSFLEKLYMFLQKNGMNCDIMDFASSMYSYDSEVFKHVAYTLCSLFEEEISSILLAKGHFWHVELNIFLAEQKFIVFQVNGAVTKIFMLLENQENRIN